MPFIVEAGRLLTGQEQAIVFDATIKGYLKEIDAASLLSPEEERELALKVIEDNDPLARDLLVRSNLRLVVSIAKKFTGRGMGLSDLIEDGNLGLIKAVDYYDPDRGTRFSTYAAWWIKQSIKRALLTNIRPVHIPTYMVTLINQWRHIFAELTNKRGRAPKIEEMANLMDLSLRKAKIIHDVVKVLSTIKDTAGADTDDEETPGLALEDHNASRPEEALESDEENVKVLSLLEEMDSRESEIIRLHYGLNGDKPMPLKDIGDKMGLTRERIRQIMRGALTNLYEYMSEE
ncbi:MAG: RNA polymerase sigma factor RpoD/SigA [Planctomycetes bacterium]|nr:RNA polymerase sigma factor RpoD/SigA [Planctomycetota bacterium]